MANILSSGLNQLKAILVLTVMVLVLEVVRKIFKSIALIFYWFGTQLYEKTRKDNNSNSTLPEGGSVQLELLFGRQKVGPKVIICRVLELVLELVDLIITISIFNEEDYLDTPLFEKILFLGPSFSMIYFDIRDLRKLRDGLSLLKTLRDESAEGQEVEMLQEQPSTHAV